MLVEYNKDENLENCLINDIFPSLKTNAHLAKYITQRAILVTRNDNIDMLNEKLIEIFLGESRTYFSFDSTVDDTQNYYQE